MPPTSTAATTSYVELREGLADDGRVVLAVDDRDRAPHPRVVTSRSIIPVYFSYSSVSMRELDDALLPVEGVTARDLDVAAR